MTPQVFYPKDSFNNPLLLDLIFKQVGHIPFFYISYYFFFSPTGSHNNWKITEKFSQNLPLLCFIPFLQIVNDTLSEACVRITRDERQKMKALFGSPVCFSCSYFSWLHFSNKYNSVTFLSLCVCFCEWQPNMVLSRIWIRWRSMWRKRSWQQPGRPGKFTSPDSFLRRWVWRDAVQC